MNKLYTIAFQRILASLSAHEIKPNNVQKILESNNVRPVGRFVFMRLPKQQIRTFLKTPCPVQSVQNDQNKELIRVSKSLRASHSLIEQKVCNRCPHKDKCPVFAKAGQELSLDAFKNLLLYMQALNQKANLNQQIQPRIWISGYKACDSILATLQDLKQGGTQTFQYERLRLQYAVQKQNKQLDKKSTEPTQNNQQIPKKQKKQKFQNQPNIKQFKNKIKRKEREIQKQIKKQMEYQQLQEDLNNQDQRPKSNRNIRNNASSRFEIRNDQENNYNRRAQRNNQKYNRRNTYNQQRQPRYQSSKNRDFSQNNRNNRRNSYEQSRYQPRQNRQFSERRNYYQSDRRQGKQGQQPRRRQQRYEREYQDRPRQNLRGQQYKKYRGNLSEDQPYKQKRYNRRQVGNAPRQQINFDKRFEQSAQTFKKSKVVQAWKDDGNQQFMSNPKIKQFKQKPRVNEPIRQRFQKSEDKAEAQAPVQRRGRRIKK